MLTQARLKEILNYDPVTGHFTWKVRTSFRVVVGKRAGTEAEGRRQIRVDGAIYREHRLAWFYMTGEWPASEVDHRDCDGTNNRWANLRGATRRENEGNKRAYSNSRSGTKGVYWHAAAKKWAASIRVNGVSVHLGLAQSKEEAAALYAAAATFYFGEFARVA